MKTKSLLKLTSLLLFAGAMMCSCGGGSSSGGSQESQASQEEQDYSRARSEVARYAGEYEIYVDNRALDSYEMGFTTIMLVTVNRDGSVDIDQGNGTLHFDDCYVADGMLIMNDGDIAFKAKGSTLDLLDEVKQQDRQEHGGLTTMVMNKKR